jgi:hypothetical protein
VAERAFDFLQATQRCIILADVHLFTAFMPYFTR